MVVYTRLLAIIAGIMCNLAVYAQMHDTTFWVPNGPVNSLVLHDTTVIIGGDFDQVSPFTGTFIRASNVNAEPDLSLFKINGPVYATCADSNGYTYVGGNFSRAGATYVENLFRITPAGLFDHSFLPQIDGPVYAICNLDSVLYVGGDFSMINGEPRGRVASFNTDTDSLTAFYVDVNGPVYCMAVDTLYGNLVLGGDFTQVGVFSPPYLAKVNLTTGDPMTFGAVPWTANGNCNAPVRDLVVDGNEVYIGGEFTTLGSTSRPGLARINLYNGLILSGNANVIGQVYALEKIDSCIYIGGAFSAVGSLPRQNLACVNMTTFAVQQWKPNANGAVRTIIGFDGLNVMVGGEFTRINGNLCGRAAFINYQDTGTWTNWNPQLNSTVHTIIKDGFGRMYIGGEFFGAGGEYRNNLCALSVNTGKTTAWNPDVNAAVNTMVLDGDSLYFAGSFATVSGIARNRIAAIELGTSALLPFNPGVNGLVRCISVDDSTIYFGGNFTSLGGQSRLNIGKVDKFTSAATPWNPGCPGTVNSILVTNHWIYIAGFYSTIAGESRENLSRLHPQTGMADWNWICNTDDGVLHAEFYNGKMAVCGWFDNINGTNVSYFSFVDTTTTQATIPNFTCDAFVLTFTTFGDDFFISGAFDLVNTQYHPRLVVYDEGNNAIDAWTPFPGAAPLAMTATANRIYLGGQMSSVVGRYHPYLQVLNIQWVTNTSEFTAQNKNFMVFPLPATEYITVVADDATDYEITDATGKIVQSGSVDLSDGREDINLSGLAPGIYILTLRGDNLIPRSQQIIRQ